MVRWVSPESPLLLHGNVCCWSCCCACRCLVQRPAWLPACVPVNSPPVGPPPSYRAWRLPLPILSTPLCPQELALSHPAVAWHRLLPAGGQGMAAVVELLLRLPGGEGAHDITLAVEFKQRLLSVFDYPPDASRRVLLFRGRQRPGWCATSSLAARHMVCSVSREQAVPHVAGPGS